MRRTAVTALAVAAVGLGALSACGDPSPLTDRPPPTQGTRDALVALRDHRFIGYSLQATASGHTVVETGQFTLHPNDFRLIRHDTSGDGSSQGYRAIGLDDHVYVQGGVRQDPAPDAVPDPSSGCWLTGRPRQLLTREQVAADRRYPLLPAVAVAVGSARGGQYVDDASPDVNGSLNLRSVLELLIPDLPAQVGSDAGRVTAELDIDGDGVLVGFSVQPYDFASAPGLPRDDVAALADAQVTVAFTLLDGDPGITAPDQGVVSDSCTEAPADSGRSGE